jgi:hypothetical protein
MIFDIFRRKSPNHKNVPADTKDTHLDGSLRSLVNGAGRVSIGALTKIAVSRSKESFQLFVTCPVLAGSGLREGTLSSRTEAAQAMPRKRRMTLLFKPTQFLSDAKAEAESLQQAIYALQKGDDSVTPDQCVFTIGREPGNDLVIPDFSISREHAVIRLRGDKIFLSDLGSSNGTLLNGVKIDSDQVEIKYSDTICFGRITFTVLSPGQLYHILN